MEKALIKPYAKIILFTLLLIYYAKVYFIDGFSQYFIDPDTLPSPGGLSYGRPSYFILAFIIGILLIWLPDSFLISYVQRKAPLMVFRFLGWVLFILPLFLIIIYYLVT
jgi:hypothetical protein